MGLSSDSYELSINNASNILNTYNNLELKWYKDNQELVSNRNQTSLSINSKGRYKACFIYTNKNSIFTLKEISNFSYDVLDNFSNLKILKTSESLSQSVNSIDLSIANLTESSDDYLVYIYIKIVL